MPETVSSTAILRTAEDGRADDGRRNVTITQDAILIERHVRGVKMRVLVPVAAYAGAVLARRRAPGSDYAIVLSHRDPELCVEVDAAADCAALTARLPGWARYFGKPAQTAGTQGAAPVFAPPRAPAASHRPRFLARRKPGVAARTETVFHGEDEIICYE